MKHKPDGFTIVELIIVIVVIAILASVSIVSYGAVRNRARDTAITTKVTDISQKLATYSIANNNKYPASLSEIETTIPNDMTITYSRTSDQKGYYITATSGPQSFSLSNFDKSPNKCDIACIPTIDPGVSTTIVASHENPPTEAASSAFDGSTSTKWLAFSSAPNVTFSTTAPIILTSYALTSANDWQSRDPRSWTLYGSNDRSSWAVINSQSNQLFTARYQQKSYSVTSSSYYKHFRLNITQNRDTDSATQLAELTLTGTTGQATIVR